MVIVLPTDENKKLPNLKILIASVLILVVVAVFIFYQYQQFKIKKELQDKENKYQTAISLVKEKKLDDALNIINQIPDYKDVPQLKAFININKDIENEIDFNIEEYNKYISDLDNILENNNGDLKQFISIYRNQLYTEKTNKSIMDLTIKYYNKGLELFEQGEYKEACFSFDLAYTYKQYKDSKDRSKICRAFEYYQKWLKQGKPKNQSNDNLGSFAAADLIDINPLVFLDWSSEIELAKNDLKYFINYFEEDRKENEEKRAVAQSINLKSGNPPIGATEEECLSYFWWKNPKDINITTTAYGTRKQYCYNGYRYLYFENGVLTAIQE